MKNIFIFILVIISVFSAVTAQNANKEKTNPPASTVVDSKLFEQLETRLKSLEDNKQSQREIEVERKYLAETKEMFDKTINFLVVLLAIIGILATFAAGYNIFQTKKMKKEIDEKKKEMNEEIEETKNNAKKLEKL